MLPAAAVAAVVRSLCRGVDFGKGFIFGWPLHRDGGSPPQQAGKHAVATLVLGTLTNVYVVLWSVPAVNRADFSKRGTVANLGSFLQGLNAMAWAATAGLLLMGISYPRFLPWTALALAKRPGASPT